MEGGFIVVVVRPGAVGTTTGLMMIDRPFAYLPACTHPSGYAFAGVDRLECPQQLQSSEMKQSTAAPPRSRSASIKPEWTVSEPALPRAFLDLSLLLNGQMSESRIISNTAAYSQKQDKQRNHGQAKHASRATAPGL